MTKTSRMGNDLLVHLFNNILAREEHAMTSGPFADTSMTEVHTIAAIGLGEPKSMSELAKALRVTTGTLTVGIGNLVKKGYVERFRCAEDKRVVKVGLTKEGRRLCRLHDHFHAAMAETVLEELSEEETRLLLHTLTKLNVFMQTKYQSRDCSASCGQQNVGELPCISQN